MHALYIQSLHNRYRLAAGERRVGAGERRAQRHRLDRVASDLLEPALDSAAALVHLDPGEHLCLRALSIRVRVQFSTTDSTIASAWSDAMVEAIRTASEAVRYPSRVLALIDVALGVARDDLTRAWAWRQLGLWQAGARLSRTEAMCELVRVLATEPLMIVPVFRVLAERGLLASFAQRLAPEHWVALAAGALSAMGSSVSWRDIEHCIASQETPSAALEPDSAAWIECLLSASRLSPALAHTRHERIERSAIAVLMLLDVTPTLTSKPREAFLRVMDGVQRTLRRGPKTEPPEVVSGAEKLARGRRRLRPHAFADAPSLCADGQPALNDLRRRAITAQGGLLFLLTVVEQLEIHRRVPDMFPHRAFSWILHRLAQALASVSPGDPAALAFAGLAPNSELPSRDAEPLSPAEDTSFSSLVLEICAEVQHRLSPLGMRPEQLVDFVCARSAEIVADPGWIEAHFSLSEVSTDIRRAALDLDPGYLSWLGLVIKFVYE